MSTASVTDTHLTFNGIRYFRGNSTAVALGSYGRKRSPAFHRPFLDVHSNLDLSTLKVAPAVVADLDSEKSSKAHVELDLHVVGAPFGGNAGGGFEALKNHKLKLVQFCVTLDDVKRAINSDSDLLQEFKDIGKTARAVHQIWLVMEATEAAKFSGDVSISATATIKTIKITATSTVSGTSSSSISLSAGSTYAYLLVKAQEFSDGKVSQMLSDQVGPG